MTIKASPIIRVASLCVIISFLLIICYLGKEILFPLLMAMLFAILLRPVVNFMNTRMRLPHVIAVSIAVIVGLAIVLGVIYFLAAQIAGFMDDLPMIKNNINRHFHHIQYWVLQTFHITVAEQNQYMDDMMGDSKMLSTQNISGLTGPILNGILIPIYTFLILIYRALILRFLIMMTPKTHHGTLAEIVFEVKSVIRSYITGLLLELAIVATMTAVGYWIIGVNYFIFLGILTGVLNLIPYVGIMVALVISILVALVSSPDLSPVIGVIVVNGLVQFIDNNILMPRIVGSKVSINAMVSIIAVIIGGHVAGIAGMFLALPIVAIVKVIFDRIDSTKPVGFLMGDNVPKTFSWRSIKLPDLNAGGHAPGDVMEELRQEESREIL